MNMENRRICERESSEQGGNGAVKGREEKAECGGGQGVEKLVLRMS